MVRRPARNAWVVRIVGKEAAWALFVAVSLGLVACGDGGDSSTGAPSSRPLVTFTVTGGIAGISERLVIDQDGSATLTTGYRPADQSTARFKLSSSELTALTDKLDAAGLDSLPKPKPTGCADCFEYTIAYGGTTYSADDVSLPEHLKQVVEALNHVIKANSKDSGLPGRFAVFGGK